MVKPTSLTIRCYGVGFGDCFLLTFHYPPATGDRHVLIDFGSTQQPPKGGKGRMLKIARDIASVVGERLHVLVASHRHADHINGFATNKRGTGPGDIIAALKPQLVIQPWTERPDAPEDFAGTSTGLKGANDGLRLSLRRMETVASVAIKEAKHLPNDLRTRVHFIGDDGIANRSAVQNLARMGKATKAAFVQYGSKVRALRTLLPGVRVSVLGPPTIKQKADVLKQKPVNKREYWHFHTFWSLRASTAEMSLDAADLFPAADAYRRARDIPIENRWFVQRLRTLRGEQLLGIVRAMDDALNNTSVILLFEAGGRKFLFPGDAQWENWELALTKRAALLKGVDVYKVGHHGSLNATPKTLWGNFSRRSKKTGPGRLCTIMSTRSDSKHGHADSGTEVPRQTLVNALKESSEHRSTQELEPGGGLVLTLEFDLRNG